MILSDGLIRQRLQDEGGLEINPLDDPDVQIQPATVDFRLGDEFAFFEMHDITAIDPRTEAASDHTKFTQATEADPFVIHPGEFALGTTKETVSIPRDLIAFVQGRSSIGRLAVVVHATAGVLDPGYTGEITLEISNLGSAPVKLPPGMRIGQIWFARLAEPAQRSYGERGDSKYQHQTGPEPSHISADFD